MEHCTSYLKLHRWIRAVGCGGYYWTRRWMPWVAAFPWPVPTSFLKMTPHASLGISGCSIIIDSDLWSMKKSSPFWRVCSIFWLTTTNGRSNRIDFAREKLISSWVFTGKARSTHSWNSNYVTLLRVSNSEGKLSNHKMWNIKKMDWLYRRNST